MLYGNITRVFQPWFSKKIMMIAFQSNLSEYGQKMYLTLVLPKVLDHTSSYYFFFCSFPYILVPVGLV